jgi:hypothetical protein
MGKGGVTLGYISGMERKCRSHDRGNRPVERVDLHDRLGLGFARFVIREVVDLLLPSQT